MKISGMGLVLNRNKVLEEGAKDPAPGDGCQGKQPHELPGLQVS